MDNVERLEGRQHSSFFLFCASGTIIDNIISMTGDMEDMVVPDIMNDVFVPQARYPENFVLISQLEVRQEGGVKKGGTWRTLRVPDRRHGGHGCS